MRLSVAAPVCQTTSISPPLGLLEIPIVASPVRGAVGTVMQIVCVRLVPQTAGSASADDADALKKDTTRTNTAANQTQRGTMSQSRHHLHVPCQTPISGFGLAIGTYEAPPRG